jgi:hypothetical protein
LAAFEKILQERLQRSAGFSGQEAQKDVFPSHNKKKEGRIAVCDLNLILLFHPRMSQYNFKVHSFQAPLPEKLKIDPSFYLRQRQAEVGRLRRALRSREEILKQERRRIKARLQSLKNKFQSQMSDLSLKREESREELSKIADRLEEEYFKERFKLETQLTEGGAKLQSWKLSNLKRNYVSQKTRHFILAEISSEVLNVSGRICDELGIDLLLDQGQKETPVPTLANRRVDPAKAGKVQNRLASFLQRPWQVGEGNAKMSIRGQFKLLASHFSRYEEMDSMLGPRVSPALHKDLTLDILHEIWTRNQIPKAVQAALHSAIMAWKKGDHS